MKLLKAELVTGRRGHNCTSCCGDIPAGTSHWQERWREEDGRVFNERYHLRCEGSEESREEYRAGLVIHFAGQS